ncbi:O-antigen ligase family protein [Roseateles sp. DC23W]|uniref:O-antigen ligase family protein n=1 Tax=Pelomonas dachongensis TaxID=3299029 RepID=A0ABW7EFV0_9BURK
MTTTPRLTNPVVIALAGYLLAMPMLAPLTGSELSAYDAARVVQLVLLPAIAALGVRAVIPALPPGMRWALLALSTLGLLSCAFAINNWMALREFLNLAGLIAVGAILAAQGRDTLAWLPKVAALAVMAYAVPVLSMAMIGATQGLPLSADLPLPGFANRRYFNHVQTVALPLAAYGVLCFHSQLLRVLTGLGLLASMVLLWVTLGRGSLVGMAAASFVLGVLWVRGRREVRTQCLVLIGGLLIAAALSTLIQVFAASAAQESGLAREPPAAELSSDHSRFGLWQRAWDMATASPWLGAGPMHYAYGHPDKAAHPHSLPLQLIAEWGFPATLLILVMWVYAMAAMARRLRTCAGRDFALGASLLACWASVFVDSWFSGLWVMPVSQMWLAALMGLSGAWLSQQNPPAASAARRWSVLPLLLTGALLLHTLPELIQLRAHLESVKLNDGARPRFWFHGQFGPQTPPDRP